MIKVIKKPKYSVICKGCGNALEFEAEDVICEFDGYCNVSSTEGGEEPFEVKRYFINCPICEGYPNVSTVTSKKIKKDAQKRVKEEL